MRRRILAGGVVTAASVATSVAGVYAAPDLLRPRLEAALSRAAGHVVTIRDMRLRPGRTLVVEARDVVVANPAGFSRPTLATIPSVRAEIAWRPLLDGVVAIERLRLDNPDARLETQDGRGNWQRPAPVAANGAAAPARSPRWRSTLGTVQVAGGHVAWRDLTGALDGTVEGGDVMRTSLVLRASLPGGEAEATVVDGAMRLTARAGEARAVLTGTLDPASWGPGDVVVDADAADLAAFPQLARLLGIDGRVALHAIGHAEPGAVTLRDLQIATRAGEVTGEVRLTASPRGITGRLASQHLDLASLLVAPAPASPPSAPPAAAPTPADPSGSPVAIPRLRGEADLALSVGELRWKGGVVRGLSGHLTLQDGRLALDPATAELGGRLDWSLHADLHADPPALALRLHGPALSIRAILEAFALPDDATGTAALEADLHAAGRTEPALLRSLSGQASVQMGDGELDNRLLGSVFSAVRVASGGGRTRVRCAILRSTVAGGVATVSPLVADTARLLVQGGGTVDLAGRRLDLRLQPLLRAGPGITIPLTLTGGWNAPLIGPDRNPPPPDAADACRDAGLATAPAKAMKPADLLRSLLR